MNVCYQYLAVTDELVVLHWELCVLVSSVMHPVWLVMRCQRGVKHSSRAQQSVCFLALRLVRNKYQAGKPYQHYHFCRILLKENKIFFVLTSPTRIYKARIVIRSLCRMNHWDR